MSERERPSMHLCTSPDGNTYVDDEATSGRSCEGYRENGQRRAITGLLEVFEAVKPPSGTNRNWTSLCNASVSSRGQQQGMDKTNLRSSRLATRQKI